MSYYSRKHSGLYVLYVSPKTESASGSVIFISTVSEHEHNVFGDSGAEVCPELAVLCPAMARAVSR